MQAGGKEPLINSPSKLTKLVIYVYKFVKLIIQIPAHLLLYFQIVLHCAYLCGAETLPQVPQSFL